MMTSGLVFNESVKYFPPILAYCYSYLAILIKKEIPFMYAAINAYEILNFQPSIACSITKT